jgi:hypothetical protein
MYVLVQHDISRPADFWGPADGMQLPPGLQLHHTFSNKDGSRAVCLWEGDSIETVRSFIENAVGRVSRNEYFQVPNREGVVNPRLSTESSRA